MENDAELRPEAGLALFVPGPIAGPSVAVKTKGRERELVHIWCVSP